MSPSEGSYFGLPLSQQTAQGPKLQMPETPFFTPGIFPATPYHHQPSESHRHQQHQENAGFAAALERGSLRHPSLAAATSGTKRLVQTSSPTHTPSISSGATPFFADLNLDTSQSNPTKSAPSPMSQPMRHRSLASNSPPVIKLPALPSPKRSSTAAAKSSTPSEAFPPIASPDILPAWFFDQLSETLVLDLRPHSVYYHSLPGRLRGSINLCVPTTLLRRPNYHLSKLIDTLPEKQQRDALGQVLAPDSGLKRVIVTDQDSVVLSPSGPLASILFKIQREREERGLTPLQLVWLKSGMQGLSRDAKLRQSGVLVLPGHSDEAFFPTTNEESPPQIVRTDSDSSDQSSNSAMSVCSTLSSDQQSDDTATPPILQVRSLPRSAFENTSTQQYKNNNPTKLSLSATSSVSVLQSCKSGREFTLFYNLM